MSKDQLRNKNYLIHDGGPCHIETSPLICRPNQWIVFYVIGTFVMNRMLQNNLNPFLLWENMTDFNRNLTRQLAKQGCRQAVGLQPYQKETPEQLFSFRFCGEIFQIGIFAEHPQGRIQIPVKHLRQHFFAEIVNS